MLSVNFNHPRHYINAMRLMQKQSLRTYKDSKPLLPNYPKLEINKAYFFTFETCPREDLDQMLYSICCFDNDGVIVFSRMGRMQVSLWRYRRQGLARTASSIESAIRNSFRREYVPLHRDEPFQKVDDGLYRCNISWNVYNSYSFTKE